MAASSQPVLRTSRRAYQLAVIALIAIGSALRLYHYDWEVGRKYTHDTGDKLAQSLNVAAGRLEPNNWKQPYFLPYAVGSIIAVADTIHPVDYAEAKRTGALLMGIMAIATVALTERLAWTVAKDGKVALLATALFAVVPLSAVGSRYIKEDIPMALWVTLTLIAMLRARAGPSLRSYGIAGLALGAAVGTKFSALLLVPTALGVHAIDFRSDQKWKLLQYAGVACVAALVAFFTLNPFALLRPGELVEGVLFQARYATGAHHDGTEIDPWSQLWTFYLRKALFPGLTPLVAAFSLVGLWQAVRRRKETDSTGFFLLVLWALSVYVVAEASSAKPYPFFARYLQAIVGPLCILAAWSLVALVNKAWGRGRLIGSAAVGLTVVVVAWPLIKSLVIVSGTAPDTRATAATWMSATLPHGSKVGLDDEPYSPPLDPLRFDIKYFGLIRDRLWTKRIDRLANEGFSYIVVNSFMTERFHETADYSDTSEKADRFYSDLAAKCPLVKEFRPTLAWQSYGFHNPIVRIYDIRGSSSLRSQR